MIIEERPKTEFNNMLLKITSGIILPKVVDAFIKNTSKPKPAIETPVYENPNYMKKDHVVKPANNINVTVTIYVCDNDLKKRLVSYYERSES